MCKKEFDYPRDFKGVWIPKEVYLDDDLNATEKIILSEIYSLDIEDTDGCYASNEYLAGFCKCSETKISNAITKLKELGYIMQTKSDGRKRWLKADLHKMYARVTKGENETYKNCKADLQEMQESNNNIYNTPINTTNNISSNTTRTEEEEKEKVGTNVPTQKKGRQVVPYIILPDTEESKPCNPNRERTYALNSMFDNCRMKVLRDFGYRESDAKWVSGIVEHFCTEYRKNTEKMHGIIKGTQLTDIIQFILNELKNGANIVEDMDNYLQNASQNKLNYQLSDYANERMAA